EPCSEMKDSSPNHKFGRQNSVTERHLGMVQALEKHLHTGFTNLFFMHADRREWWVHQDGFFAVVETNQAYFFRHFDSMAPQRHPQPIRRFIIARYHSCRSRLPR